eukprot:scaffold55125_cov57-Phaeocystis_antarctica.AAC.2
MSVVRARSCCPISGGSAFSGQPRRSSEVRARSCPIWGGSTSSLLFSRSRYWTRSSRQLTPFHERGLSPLGQYFCSAGLAARIARSVYSSASDISRFIEVLQSTSAWHQLAVAGTAWFGGVKVIVSICLSPGRRVASTSAWYQLAVAGTAGLEG